MPFHALTPSEATMLAKKSSIASFFTFFWHTQIVASSYAFSNSWCKTTCRFSTVCGTAILETKIRDKLRINRCAHYQAYFFGQILCDYIKNYIYLMAIKPIFCLINNFDNAALALVFRLCDVNPNQWMALGRFETDKTALTFSAEIQNYFAFDLLLRNGADPLVYPGNCTQNTFDRLCHIEDTAMLYKLIANSNGAWKMYQPLQRERKDEGEVNAVYYEPRDLARERFFKKSALFVAKTSFDCACCWPCAPTTFRFMLGRDSGAAHWRRNARPHQCSNFRYARKNLWSFALNDFLKKATQRKTMTYSASSNEALRVSSARRRDC